MNTHDKYELPAEFRSGNNIPVERATITRERMLEILQAAIEADRKRTTELLKNPVHVHTNMCRGIIAPITFDMLAHVLGEEATQAWLNDRQRRGEPVGYLVELDGRDTYVSADRTVRDAHLTYGWRPVYAAPQPAEPCASSVSDKTACGAQNAECEPQPAEPVKRKRRYAQGTALGEFGIIPMCDQVDDEPVKVPSEIDIFELWSGDPTHSQPIADKGKVLAFARALLARYGQQAQPAASAEPVRVRDESQPIYLDGVQCQYSIEKGDPWPYSETVAYVFEREDAELIAAALNAAPVAAQPSVPEPLKYGREWKDHYVTGWNNCRAAMLAAEQAQQECGCCGRSDGCDPDCDASQPAANDNPTPEEEEAWQRMERRS